MYIYIAFSIPIIETILIQLKLYNFLIYLDISKVKLDPIIQSEVSQKDKENPILYQHICWKMFADFHENFYILA